jgi:aryl-alcohol dehydrogenase-like predicted oxidoreductase
LRARSGPPPTRSRSAAPASSSAASAWAPAATAATSSSTWAAKGFTSLIRYAYDQGITWFDCSQTYKTFEWLGGAIKGLPRDKVFIQSKIPGQPEDILKAIDRHRQVYDTDYLDSLLVHCMVKDGWTDAWKRILDGFDTAKDKGWIRSKGVSCHSLPALRTATPPPPGSRSTSSASIRRASASTAKRNRSGTTTSTKSPRW